VNPSVETTPEYVTYLRDRGWLIEENKVLGFFLRNRVWRVHLPPELYGDKTIPIGDVRLSEIAQCEGYSPSPSKQRGEE
jgi:hypothetical protein